MKNVPVGIIMVIIGSLILWEFKEGVVVYLVTSFLIFGGFSLIRGKLF